MLKNYLTIALRNIMRQKLYAFINIFGLALGIACCLLMALFVKHEWSHDRFHANKERIFRIAARGVQPNDEVRYFTLLYPEVPQTVKDAVPGIVRASGFIYSNGRVTYGERTFREDVGLVSPDFLTMFTFPLLAGDPATALNRPDGIVITETVARQFFEQIDPGYGNVMGQPLSFPGRDIQCIITGVAASVPSVSSLDFDVLIPLEHHKKFGKSSSGNACIAAYVQLADEYPVPSAETAMNPLVTNLMSDRIKDLKKWASVKDSDDAISIHLQSLTDIYWNHQKFRNYYENGGNLTGVYILWGIAILVLLIACSNFTTLSIAQSSSRSKEVGMRKVLGANRTQIMQQFWSETLLLSFISLLLGIALAELFLPVFNTLIQRELAISYFSDASFLLILMLIVTVVGVLAGSYPSLMLSRFQPVSAMKGEHRLGGRSRLTRSLVVLQYAISIALMICTGVMMYQQAYVRSRNLGYDQEHIVVVRTDSRKVADRYKEALLKNPRVLGVTLTDRAFTTGSSSTGYELPDGTQTYVRLIGSDADFIPTLKIDLIEGRNFSADHPSDRTEAVIINETLARMLPQQDLMGNPLPGFKWFEFKNPIVIGVVRDFHIDGLHRKIQPLVLQMRRFNYWPSMMIRIQPGNIAETVEELKVSWKTVASSDEPIRLSFLDENLDRQYREEQRWQRILTYASLFAIAISCLGLLGLASLAVARRTKEIGIRKVLGATVPNLVGLLSKDFALLLLLANLIAWPIAYWAMNKWLENFAYRIELGPGVFILSGALALCVALLTISLQTVKAARRNPVDALRYE